MEKENFFKEVVDSPDLFSQFLNILDKEISLPNIPLPTFGGDYWWQDLVSYKGIRLQQNYFSKHCRILDENNVRLAWGTKNGMIKALDTLYDLQNKYK